MSKPTLDLDTTLSGEENVLNLLVHTHPEFEGQITLENMSLESKPFGGHPLYNSQIKVTVAGETLEGTTVYPYNRVNITRPTVIVPLETGLAAYFLDNPLADGLEVKDLSDDIKLVRPVVDSLTYTGSYQVRLAGAGDIVVNYLSDVLTTTTLDGFHVN